MSIFKKNTSSPSEIPLSPSPDDVNRIVDSFIQAGRNERQTTSLSAERLKRLQGYRKRIRRNLDQAT